MLTSQKETTKDYILPYGSAHYEIILPKNLNLNLINLLDLTISFCKIQKMDMLKLQKFSRTVGNSTDNPVSLKINNKGDKRWRESLYFFVVVFLNCT